MIAALRVSRLAGLGSANWAVAPPFSTQITKPPASLVILTLRRLVVLCRLVGWAWALAMVIATIYGAPQSGVGWVIVVGVVSTIWTGLTLLGARGDLFLSRGWFVASDGLVSFLLAVSAVPAGAPDFISGGYPMSWLFVVAYATTVRSTMVAASLVTIYIGTVHVLLGLGIARTIGSIQFLVVGLIVGWAFDSLRKGEVSRLRAESDLREVQAATARHQERANLARKLHDSVLQTLQMVRANADDADEVRYLARRQERELRRTIDEYRSPHERSFRAELLGARDRVEDLCRIQIEAVIRDDAELDSRMTAAIEAAQEAMMNAAKHSGATQVHLYSEITDDQIRINVRDRGHGLYHNPMFTPVWLSTSLRSRLAPFGGVVRVDCPVEDGTDVTITLSRS
jgi:signal transduction histidine kinase